METIDPIDAFGALDLRVGRIVDVEPNSAARAPAYVIAIDFGPLGRRTTSAQLTALYRPDELRGRLVIAAVNLGEKRIAGVKSEVLVLGLPDENDDVVLLTAERDVPPGGRVY